jgi:hypothetical protein
MGRPEQRRELEASDPRTATVQAYVQLVQETASMAPMVLQRERDAALLEAVEADGESRRDLLQKIGDLDREFVRQGTQLAALAAARVNFLAIAGAYSSNHGLDARDWEGLGLSEDLARQAVGA